MWRMTGAVGVHQDIKGQETLLELMCQPDGVHTKTLLIL